MANFIRIGETVINVDQVVDFDLKGDAVTVTMAVLWGNSGRTFARSHTFEGKEAKALRAWVDQRAYVLPVEAEDTPKGADLVAF